MADIHIGPDAATSAERAAIDAVVAPGAGAVVFEGERLARGGNRRRKALRHRLLPTLHALQHEIGWISPGAVNLIGERLQVPPAEAYGVATFYSLFRTTDPGHRSEVTHICVDPVCRLAGSREAIAVRRSEGAHVEESPCLGQCERAPAEFVQGCATPDRVPADAEPYVALQGGEPGLRVMRRVGVVDPTSLDSYRSSGGYRALHRAIGLGPDAVIEALASSGLTGRGGAAFPIALKWRAVADADAETRHVVANGDESEPGTFKDRVLMEHDPFALVEAMTIAGLTTGAAQGWVYIRGEYPRAAQRVQAAIDAAKAAGLLGDDVAGTGRGFTIEVRRGAGAYICGEETALFNSIEGFRGEPRNKPPFPTSVGLFGAPTVINNPETLANVLDIVVDGPDVFRSLGTDRSPGTKLFCVSGAVGAAGVYEMPFGTTLAELLERAGGTVGTLRAVLLGGAAGSFIEPSSLPLPLTLEDTRAAGTTIGSGAVTVFDDTADMVDVVGRIAEFFRDESCGQCVPCRVGTQRQHEVMVDLGRTRSLTADRRHLVDDLATVMADASICGLGHTAGGAVRSALALGLIGAS